MWPPKPWNKGHPTNSGAVLRWIARLHPDCPLPIAWVLQVSHQCLRALDSSLSQLLRRPHGMCENVHITESATRIYELILAHISMGKWWKANNATHILVFVSHPQCQSSPGSSHLQYCPPTKRIIHRCKFVLTCFNYIIFTTARPT